MVSFRDQKGGCLNWEGFGTDFSGVNAKRLRRSFDINDPVGEPCERRKETVKTLPTETLMVPPSATVLKVKASADACARARNDAANDAGNYELCSQKLLAKREAAELLAAEKASMEERLTLKSILFLLKF